MKALTHINLPPNNRKKPGETITQKELNDAGQTDEDVKKLMKDGAIGQDGDAIHSAHDPIKIETSTTSDVHVVDHDTAEGGDSN